MCFGINVWFGLLAGCGTNVKLNKDCENITGLSNGLHSIAVYANDSFGNMGVSETVTFKIALPFPIVLVVTVSAATVGVVVCAFVIFYVKKQKY